MRIDRPPMGWNSWNTFGNDISEDLILKTADVMADEGLLDAGYKYLVIDDCWSLKERDKDGRLVPDPEKFPHGMKYLADYIHGKGLKFGMYSCAGTQTCAGYPGSFEHEFTDAATFAGWGVDYLKYDYCYHSPIIPGKYLYRRMGLALANCGRDILFAACSWGSDETQEWIKTTGASIWRSTGDIFDTWQSVKDLADRQDALLPYNGHGCFNDMDMLIVGMHGKGNVGLSGCSDVQYRTHFSLWAFMGSPLMIGCDIRNMGDVTRQTLTNRELIRINQDGWYSQPFALTPMMIQSGVKIYAKLLENGDVAVGCFNMEDTKTTARFNIDEIGLPVSTGKTLKMREVWSGQETAPREGTVFWDLDPYGCAVFRCRLTDLA